MQRQVIRIFHKKKGEFHMEKVVLAVFLSSMAIPLLMSTSCAEDGSGSIAVSKDFWDFSRIEWGDGRPYEKPVKKEGPYPQGFVADYEISVPAEGWYELVYTNAGEGMRHDLILDGTCLWRFRTTSRMEKGSKDAKAGNIWLSSGKHVLRIQRIGRTSFPIMMIGGFELRAAGGRPEACITAEKTLVDIVRAGEKLEIKVTGGGAGKEAAYELLRRDLTDASRRPELVAEVSFPPAARPETRNLAIPCPAEGAFSLSARVKGGRDLLPCEFPIGEYAVIDVAAAPKGGGGTVPVHVIDCVAQTDNGTPVPDGAFVECNGPTRVVRTAAVSYRESHDCTVPGSEPMKRPDDPHSYSGFSYRIDLPELQVPYLIDVEFPDDARRSVTISQNWIDEKTGGFAKGTAYSAKAYETGGMQPLSGQIRHHRTIVWAASKRMMFAILTQQVGHRAAASKITVSRFEGDQVPAAKADNPGGRVFCHWYEEAENWRYLVNVASAYQGGIVHDMVGLDRWARLCRYFGVNGISACGAGYQGAFWRTTTLDGFMPTDYDQCRLAALICEKYGMRYTPEVFPAQWYMNLVTLPALAENPDDVRSFSCHGAARGQNSAVCDLNPLHPVVQKAWIDAFGELADKLRDSPAFCGITVRADGWLFRGDYTFPSLNWGYGDWIIRQFEKDSGTKVPGADDDPGRFLKRYEFLVSKDMLDKWISWRNHRILDYHLRIRDRIRGSRPDIFFGIFGDFRCDPCYDQPSSVSRRALECGVDLEKLKSVDGLAMIPGARYGFRNLGVQDQRIYDDFLDPENVGAGMGVNRSFAAYMYYQELATFWPAEKLGVAVGKEPVPYYCSAALASGRNSLEKFAVVLAEQDSSFLRDGGNTDIYGDPEIWNPWFAEFCALPALPFERVESARDPVAVWQKMLSGSSFQVPGKTEARNIAPDAFYFYAVNREQYPVRIEITLAGTDEVFRLGTGEKIRLTGAVLPLDLEPYELRSFRTSASASVVTTKTIVPEDKISYVRNRIAFAQDVANMISGPRKDDFSAADRGAFMRQIAAAWDAYSKGWLWRARTSLSMAPALKIYEDTARMPEGQVVTKFPGLLQERPREGHWIPKRPVIKADALEKMLPSGSKAVIKPSSDINKEWGGSQILAADSGMLELTLEIPADGPYVIRIGHVSPLPGVTVASINGESLPSAMETSKPCDPETFAFPALKLKAGKAQLSMRRDGPFGVYALQILPLLKPMPNSAWSVVGPFPGFWGLHVAGRRDDAEGLRKSFETIYGPEQEVDLGAAYRLADGRELRWTQKTDSTLCKLDDLVVSMPIRTGSSQADVNFAVTFIDSDTDRSAQLHLGVDWWAVAWLNGERLRTSIDPKTQQESGGADFTTHYPMPAVLNLKKGVNTLLVKQNGGSLGSAMAAYITDDHGISLSPKPK